MNMPTDVPPPEEVANPLVTGPLRRTLFFLALPVLGEQLLNFLVGFFDVWLSGHLPGELRTDATAAVGVAAYSSWLATLIFSLVGTGTTALISRAWGAGKREEANRIANRSVVLSVMMGLLFLAFILLSARLMVVSMGLDGRAAEIGERFLRIDSIGLIFASISLVIAAAMRGCGDMRTPMWSFAAVNVLNVIFSTGLVYGLGPFPRLGVDGIVTGTVIARSCGGLIFLGWLWHGIKGLTLDVRELRLGGEIIGRILRIGMPAAAEGIVIWIGHVLFLRIISLLGQTVFTAHIVGIRVEALTYLPAVAWGAAAATMVGQSLGAGKPERAYQAGQEAALQCSLFGLGITLWFVFGADSIYSMMHQDPTVQEVGSFPFQVVGLFQIPLILSIVYCSALRGGGDTVFPLASAILTTYFVRLPIAWYCVKTLDMGLMGAWMGMNIDMLARGGLATWWYTSRRWIKLRL